ncbi:hypothetical protein NU195Hw_g8037t1 [Hortaea werneckii]
MTAKVPAEDERLTAENDPPRADNERRIAEKEPSRAENERRVAENERLIAESERRMPPNEPELHHHTPVAKFLGKSGAVILSVLSFRGHFAMDSEHFSLHSVHFRASGGLCVTLRCDSRERNEA